MAHGHPDYWNYSSPQLPVPGPEQIPLWQGRSVAIAGGAVSWVATYTTLANETAYFTGGMISTDFARIQRYYFVVGVAVYPDLYYDTVGMLPLNPSAVIEVPALTVINLMARNDDVNPHTFSAVMFGFRVTIVPGTPPPVGLGLLVAGAGV